ncbi:unnamed protein product, partial [Ascophyllum nodosum]
FANNSAKLLGGGIYVLINCTVSWSGETIFSSNTAEIDAGGAIFLWNYSTASWNSETTFTNNTAPAGGAVLIIDNCADKVTFVGNTALTTGGAVAVFAKISTSDRGSPFVLAGPTVFEKNTCERIGGALGLIGGVLVQLETTEIVFSGNRAAIAGGAISMWGNDLGPYYIGVNFFSNFASHGGGVYSAGSGNALYGLDSEQRSNPVVFIGCSFVENQAIATGGAIHSAAGQDLVINTTFSGNIASEGGAL